LTQVKLFLRLFAKKFPKNSLAYVFCKILFINTIRICIIFVKNIFSAKEPSRMCYTPFMASSVGFGLADQRSAWQRFMEYLLAHPEASMARKKEMPREEEEVKNELPRRAFGAQALGDKEVPSIPVAPEPKTTSAAETSQTRIDTGLGLDVVIHARQEETRAEPGKDAAGYKPLPLKQAMAGTSQALAHTQVEFAGEGWLKNALLRTKSVSHDGAAHLKSGLNSLKEFSGQTLGIVRALTSVARRFQKDKPDTFLDDALKEMT
jgi:hypothetical protein